MYEVFEDVFTANVKYSVRELCFMELDLVCFINQSVLWIYNA